VKGNEDNVGGKKNLDVGEEEERDEERIRVEDSGEKEEFSVFRDQDHSR
jgi:hypothetical protein